jgi:hypothetical protein
MKHILERTLVWALIGWSLVCVWRGDMQHAGYWLILAGLVELDDLFPQGGKPA